MIRVIRPILTGVVISWLLCSCGSFMLAEKGELPPPPPAAAVAPAEEPPKAIPVQVPPPPPLEMYALTLPRFPWPPPKYSAIANIPVELMRFRGKSPTLENVAKKLEMALEEAGYGDKSYYYVPNGFALITRVERIHEDGRPFGDNQRWTEGALPLERFSLGSYLEALIKAPPGHYRVIVFAVTDRSFAPSSETPDAKVFSELALRGSNRLSKEIALLRYSSSYRCTALIYEFVQKRTDKKPAYVCPSGLTGKLHLARAGITEGLKK